MACNTLVTAQNPPKIAFLSSSFFSLFYAFFVPHFSPEKGSIFSHFFSHFLLIAKLPFILNVKVKNELHLLIGELNR